MSDEAESSKVFLLPDISLPKCRAIRDVPDLIE